MVAPQSFFDQRRPDKPSSVREFCAECQKPRRMRDDDLEEIFSRSDYCNCARRGR